jgi:regulator of protease activity HflC (stomatin/prohibitin superfamily)
MVVIVVGILALIVSYATSNSYDPVIVKARPYLRYGGLAIFLVGVAMSSFKQIEAGEVGVQTLFGKVQDKVLPSGLNIVNPLVEIHPFVVKTQNYTMAAARDEGDKQGDDAIRVLSHDGLEVVIDLTVLYSVKADQAPNILRKIGEDYKNTIVRPISRTKIRDNAVAYDAVSLYSTKRAEFQSKIFADIETNFRERGLVLEQLLIRNITLPASVKTTIESKINAEQDAQKMEFVLQKERQEAERKRVEAQGIADYQRIISTNLTDKQLQYEQIKANLAIANSTNTKVIILGANGKQPLMIDTK